MAAEKPAGEHPTTAALPARGALDAAHDTSPADARQSSTDMDVTEAAAIAVGDAGAAPARIGRYKIRRVIASGGMGTVYEAEQEQPQRTVALKIIKAGIASPELLRRFDYESQLLARLRHPAIAEVYEAGTHGEASAATPYFAMEFVPHARLITEYAAAAQLDLRRKLELFCRVGDAIAHGHSRGIIHRDIKPQNILVDGEGNPKVIDFGVARMTDTDNYAATQQTEVGQLVGTLQYMSPEQTEADPRELDIRSDIYSLGLLLYEMLAGSRPYEVGRTNIFAATQIVREQPPVPLSKVDQRLRGDVETIVLKALAKNRDERYQTADAFVADVRRYLANEPIAARPPSVAYQLRKFAQRNKPLVAGAAAALAALLVGLVVSTWMYLVAEDARGKTEQARRDAVAAQQDAEEQRDIAEGAKTQLAGQLAETTRARDAERIAKEQAEIESSTSAAVNKYLNGILAAASPFELGRDVTVAAALDDASAGVDTAFVDQPRVEAEVRMTLGRTYYNLGKYEQAEVHFRRAVELWEELVGPESREALYAKFRIVRLLDNLDRDEEYQQLLGEVYEAQRRVLGEDDEDTLDTMREVAEVASDNGDYQQAEELLRRVLAAQHRHLADENPLATKATDVLAEMLKTGRAALGIGGDDKALLDAQRIVLRGEEPETLSVMTQLAGVLMAKGDLPQAESIYRQVYDARREYWGHDSPSTLSSMSDVADVMQAQDKLEEAEKWYRSVLAHRNRVLGPEHADTLSSTHELAENLFQQGRIDECQPLFQRAFQERRKYLGADNRKTLHSFHGAEWSLMRLGRHVQAEALARSVLGELEQQLAADDFYLPINRQFLVLALLAQGEAADAEPIVRQNISILQQYCDEDHPNLLLAQANLAWCLIERGEAAQAETLLAACFALHEARSDHSPGLAARMKARLGRALLRQDKFAEAEPWLIDSLPLLRDELGDKYFETYCAHRDIVDLYTRWEKPDQLAGYDGLLQDDYQTGYRLFRNNQTQQALETFDRLLQNNPHHADALHYRAHCYEKLRFYKNAVDDFTRALALQPDDAHLLASRGNNRYRLQQWELCAQDWQKSLDLQPDQVSFCVGLARLYSSGPPVVRDPEAALALALRAEQLMPQNVAPAVKHSCLTTLGAAYYRHDELDKAAESLEQARSLVEAPSAECLFYLAMTHQRMDMPDDARKRLEEAQSSSEKNGRDDFSILLQAEAENLIHDSAAEDQN